MNFSIEINNCRYKIDAEKPLDISISLDFGGAQPNVFGVEKASARACEAGNLIGDTRRGGSCNFEQVKFVPHCNGTHTESVGHLSRERISVRDCLKDAFIFAALISVAPENANRTNENYAVELDESEQLITKKSLEKALRNLARRNSESEIRNPKSEGLIVRTLPNDESKKSRDYSQNQPPFFSTEAMRFIVEKGVRHLLVDTPSIDRMQDEGKLANHRIFWNIEPGSFELNEKSFRRHTITEMIFASDVIKDGAYLLNLQIAPFASDAAPSRPVLFAIENLTANANESASFD